MKHAFRSKQKVAITNSMLIYGILSQNKCNCYKLPKKMRKNILIVLIILLNIILHWLLACVLQPDVQVTKPNNEEALLYMRVNVL